MITEQQLAERGWKLPRGFCFKDGRVALIPYGETGFDPMAANVNLQEYFDNLADTAARYISSEDFIPPQA